MQYKILPYTFAQAKKIGVKVQPSKRKNKKIDVYKDGLIVASVGDSKYLDYPYYRKYFGEYVANIRRKEYRRRHQKDRKIMYSPGWYADKLLW